MKTVFAALVFLAFSAAAHAAVPSPSPDADPYGPGASTVTVQGFSFKVSESYSHLTVKSWAPIPTEVQSENEAQALARDAAVVVGQNSLLAYILQKKARSGRPLSVAEVPSVELGKGIRDYVKKAEVTSTKFKDGRCRLTLSLDKKYLRQILHKN